jgi:hypothetical protein
MIHGYARVSTAARRRTHRSLPKLVIIGINQSGSDLIQLVPEIAMRTGIHKIAPGRPSDIAERDHEEVCRCVIEMAAGGAVGFGDCLV